VVDHRSTEKRFGAIVYDSNTSEFVFSARRANDTTSSRICQLQQGAYEIPVHLLLNNLSAEVIKDSPYRHKLKDY